MPPQLAGPPLDAPPDAPLDAPLDTPLDVRVVSVLTGEPVATLRTPAGATVRHVKEAGCLTSRYKMRARTSACVLYIVARTPVHLEVSVLVHVYFHVHVACVPTSEFTSLSRRLCLGLHLHHCQHYLRSVCMDTYIHYTLVHASIPLLISASLSLSLSLSQLAARSSQLATLRPSLVARADVCADPRKRPCARRTASVRTASASSWGRAPRLSTTTRHWPRCPARPRTRRHSVRRYKRSYT